MANLRSLRLFLVPGNVLGAEIDRRRGCEAVKSAKLQHSQADLVCVGLNKIRALKNAPYAQSPEFWGHAGMETYIEFINWSEAGGGGG